MSYVEKFANYVDSDEIAQLFDNYQKTLGDNRTLAAKQCGITTKAVYDWKNRKEGIKHSTKIKILETLLERAPVDTFLHMTGNLHISSLETLLAGLSTLYEQSFEAKSESEFLELTKLFETITHKYSGLIHNNKELEVNKMFKKLYEFAKMRGYNWKPRQAILYDLDAVKRMIPRIINSWAYSGFSQSAEKIAVKTKLPLQIVSTVGNEINQQLMQTYKSSNENTTSDEKPRTKVPIERYGILMTSISRASRTASTLTKQRPGV